MQEIKSAKYGDLTSKIPRSPKVFNGIYDFIFPEDSRVYTSSLVSL